MDKKFKLWACFAGACIGFVALAVSNTVITSLMVFWFLGSETTLEAQNIFLAENYYFQMGILLIDVFIFFCLGVITSRFAQVKPYLHSITAVVILQVLFLAIALASPPNANVFTYLFFAFFLPCCSLAGAHYYSRKLSN